MNDTWITFKNFFLFANALSILATLSKALGLIGDYIPWWFVSGPLILDMLALALITTIILIFMFYISICDSIKKKYRKNSQKKPPLK